MRIKLVATPDNLDDEVKKVLDTLDKEIFYDSPIFDKKGSWWWIVYDDDKPVAFAGLTPYPVNKTMFLSRCGVVKQYRGLGLQKKLIKKREKVAKEREYKRIITYTSYDNIQSANNLIKMGYRLYTPKFEWGMKYSYYLVKYI